MSTLPPPPVHHTPKDSFPAQSTPANSSFWLRDPTSNPLACKNSSSDVVLPEEADVCIIGSGMTGVCAAYHFARRVSSSSGNDQLKVLILEARDFCSGATGRNAGHLTAMSFQCFRMLQSEYGTEEARKAYRLERYSVAELIRLVEVEPGMAKEIDLVEGGHVSVFVEEEEYQEARSDWEAAVEAGMGEEEMGKVVWMDKDKMKEVCFC